jgi:hypothetical protein
LAKRRQPELRDFLEAKRRQPELRDFLEAGDKPDSEPGKSRHQAQNLPNLFNSFPVSPSMPTQPACYPEIEKTPLLPGGAASGVPSSTRREGSGSCLEQRS